MITYIEKVNWLEQFPNQDDNGGYIYGVNYLDFENEGDILDCEWFKTEEERERAINEIENFRIVF